MCKKLYRIIMFLSKVIISLCFVYVVMNIASTTKQTSSSSSPQIIPKPKVPLTHTPISSSKPILSVTSKPNVSTVHTRSATRVTKNTSNTTNPHSNNNKSDIIHIYEHPFSYLHVPVKVCTSNGATSDPFLLVVVKSDVNHISHRIAIRSTWGKSNLGLKFVYLLGYSPLLETFIQMETNLYNDILQETFIDDYRNNTIKTIMGFHWVSSHCASVKYVFFVDDDYIVNIKYLWDHVHRLYAAGQSSIFSGYLWKNAKVERNKASKWYISKEEYSEDVWPPYASGGSMLISIDIVTKLSNTFKFVKPFFIDDTYIGVLVKMLGISLTHEARFYPFYQPYRMNYLFTSHGFSSPMNLVNDWTQYHKKYDMVV